MKFSVVVRASDGSESTQVIEAENRFAVYRDTEKNGAAVVSVEEKGGGFSLSSLTHFSITSGRVKMDQRIAFTKNLSAMLSAGLTLSRALSVIERQSSSQKLKEVVSELEAAVRGGSAFHEALQVHPKVFSRLFVAMTKAGEESGQLAGTLTVVARQMETSYQLTKKVKGAMIYPSIILGAVFIIGILMLIFVVPTLSSTFVSLGVELPLSTRLIIGASNFAINHVIIMMGIIILIVGGMFAFLRSKPGQTALLFVALHAPVVGQLVRETYSARAARTLSSLLSSGVEMLTAISITGEVVGENIFGNVLTEAGTDVKQGGALSATFMKYPKLYPIFVSEMISVGEETGKVSDMLGQVASYYESDVEARTKDLSTIIEPVLMLFIGVFVGIFALSMIAPIYSLSDKI